jgi:hypothetical protein
MATSAFFGEVKVGLSGGDGEDSLLCLLIIAAHGLPTVSWLEMLTECLQSSLTLPSQAVRDERRLLSGLIGLAGRGKAFRETAPPY